MAESLLLLSEHGDCHVAATLAGKKLVAEESDGVAKAVESFYRNLPTGNMICEVSIFLGEIRRADFHCIDCGLSMNEDVSAMVHWGGRGAELADALGISMCGLCETAEDPIPFTDDTPHESFETHNIQKLQYINWTKRRSQQSGAGTRAESPGLGSQGVNAFVVTHKLTRICHNLTQKCTPGHPEHALADKHGSGLWRLLWP